MSLPLYSQKLFQNLPVFPSLQTPSWKSKQRRYLTQTSFLPADQRLVVQQEGR